jgi:hypothetical protein
MAISSSNQLHFGELQEDMMQGSRLFGSIMAVALVGLMVFMGGCFNTGSSTGTATAITSSIKPEPVIESLTSTTSGTEGAYYAILDIKVKNNGAEGTILVIASVTQNDKTIQNEMPVYLMKGVTHELKMTFPLNWKGGEWKAEAHTQIP